MFILRAARYHRVGRRRRAFLETGRCCRRIAEVLMGWAQSSVDLNIKEITA
jgi:hypothetical protein